MIWPYFPLDNEEKGAMSRGRGSGTDHFINQAEKDVNGRVQAPSRHLAGDDIRLQHVVVRPEGTKGNK